MSPARVLLELPVLLLAPLTCRFRGHRWHTWIHHGAPEIRICVRCGHTHP